MKAVFKNLPPSVIILLTTQEDQIVLEDGIPLPSPDVPSLWVLHRVNQIIKSVQMYLLIYFNALYTHTSVQIGTMHRLMLTNQILPLSHQWPHKNEYDWDIGLEIFSVTKG